MKYLKTLVIAIVMLCAFASARAQVIVHARIGGAPYHRHYYHRGYYHRGYEGPHQWHYYHHRAYYWHSGRRVWR